MESAVTGRVCGIFLVAGALLHARITHTHTSCSWRSGQFSSCRDSAVMAKNQFNAQIIVKNTQTHIYYLCGDSP